MGVLCVPQLASAISVEVREGCFMALAARHSLAALRSWTESTRFGLQRR